MPTQPNAQLELTGAQAVALARMLQHARPADVIRVWANDAGDVFAIGADVGLLSVAPDGSLPADLSLPSGASR